MSRCLVATVTPPDRRRPFEDIQPASRSPVTGSVTTPSALPQWPGGRPVQFHRKRMSIEEVFEIEISDEDAAKLLTVRDAVELVRARRAVCDSDRS